MNKFGNNYKNEYLQLYKIRRIYSQRRPSNRWTDVLFAWFDALPVATSKLASAAPWPARSSAACLWLFSLTVDWWATGSSRFSRGVRGVAIIWIETTRHWTELLWMREHCISRVLSTARAHRLANSHDLNSLIFGLKNATRKCFTKSKGHFPNWLEIVWNLVV